MRIHFRNLKFTPVLASYRKKTQKRGETTRYYLEGVVFGVICILLIKLLLSI